MYLYRHMEMALRKAVKQSKVVLLTGARQVGKSTSMQIPLKRNSRSAPAARPFRFERREAPLG